MKCFLGTSHDHNCKVLKQVSNPTLLGSFQSSQQPQRLPVEASCTKQGASSLHQHRLTSMLQYLVMKAYRKTDRYNRQTNRHTDRQTGRQTDGRTHRQTHRQHTQTYMDIHYVCTWSNDLLYTAQILVRTMNNRCKVLSTVSKNVPMVIRTFSEIKCQQVQGQVS